LFFRLIGGVVIACALAGSVRADDRPYHAGDRTRGLIGGWAHSWRPIFGQTSSEITFTAMTPRIGWFVTDWGELYGEATLFVYHAPVPAVSAGAGALAGRYYLRDRGRWMPYAMGGGGLLWTSLDGPEIDRIFNFQLFFGIGVRQNRPSGPCLVFEFRNHHISNAGTAGRNLGINAAMALAGVEWVLRRSPGESQPTGKPWPVGR
jgi:lipid A 3-O-deacylase